MRCRRQLLFMLWCQVANVAHPLAQGQRLVRLPREEHLEAAARRFRTLGVPSRLRILSALMDGPLGMAELESATGLEQSNLSRQVTELEREGCVARLRTGRTVESGSTV